ncbi:6391_t:CDS:2, partial [Gigaspora rosea]
AGRVTWSKLNSTDKFLLPLVSYYQLVVGSHMQEIIELRQSYIRGLVPNKLLEHITVRLTSVNTAKTLMQSFVSIVWNSFYESIWKERKVKIAGKEKTSVNNTNASSSEVCLEKSTLLLNDSEKDIEEKSHKPLAYLTRLSDLSVNWYDNSQLGATRQPVDVSFLYQDSNNSWTGSDAGSIAPELANHLVLSLFDHILANILKLN